MGGIRETVQGIAESIRDAETTMKLNNIFGKNTIVTIKGRYGHIIHKAKHSSMGTISSPIYHLIQLRNMLT